MSKLRKQQLLRLMRHHNKIILLLCASFGMDAHAVVCGVSATAVNFGSYNVYASTNIGTQGQITVSCNPVSTYTVALNGGTYGTIAQRKMHSGSTSETMNYNLYIDAAHTNLWGDGTSNGNTVTSAQTTPIAVYGVIPPLQDVSVGTYADNVAITVTF